MKNFTPKFAALIAFALIMGSCARDNSVVSNHRIQKRKHTGGFHIDFNKKYKVQKDDVAIEEEDIALTEKKETPNLTPVNLSLNNISVQNDGYEKVVERNESLMNHALTANDETIEISGKTVAEKSQIESLSFADVHKNQSTKQAIKEMRREIKEIKKVKKDAPLPIEAVVYILLCIFIPFVAVGLATDWDLTKVLISLLLSFLFWIPGIIYAFIVCNDEGVI
jgi:uncharacterized membrane protein YqaE (UPF0057 family)